ncbi:unnamed protein product, partial [Symbiodinium necroappetens]
MSMEALVQLAQQGAYDKEAVQRLRALRREALEELLKELWEPAMSVGLGGAWAVHAAWLASPERLAELATSGSHAVGVRALTALLKTDPARLIGLLGLPQGGGAVEGSPLSAARRRVSLRALGRLSHNALQGLVTEELLSELVSTDGASAARLLKGASPELIERWWPRLAVPSNTAVSIAARLPQLTLRLIVSSQQKQWADQELREDKPTEVPGGAAHYTFLEALAWQPYAEAGLASLFRCASREGPVAVRDALSFLEVRLRNEQDSVRAAVLREMAKAPVLLWQDVHLNSLRQLLTSSMQAKGSSSESLGVWQKLVEVFVANGAALRTEAGLGPCGAFGMEVRSQLTAADLWDQEVAAFGTSVLGHVARLEPQPAFVAFPWLVDLLRPSIRALLDSEKVDEACALLARWEGTRLELLQGLSRDSASTPDVPDACAAFDVLLRETFATAIQESRSFNPSAAKAAQEALRSLLLPSYAHLKNSGGLTWAQEQAVRRLCRLGSSRWQSFVGFFGSELPWHTTLALAFLGSSEARQLRRRNGALFEELVQALCTNWDMLPEWQRAQFAAAAVQHLGSACRSMEICLLLAPLLHRLCDWPFSLAITGEQGSKKFRQSVDEIGEKIRLRRQAEELLARHKPLKASLLEGWRRQDASLQAERLCTSTVLLRAMQHKPEAIQLLVAFESSKLQQLRLLQEHGAWPLHFFGQQWTGNKGPRLFFSWPAALQRSFAEIWLASGPLDLQEFLDPRGGSQVREKCRLRLLLPALRCEELLGGVVEACVKVLKQEEEEEEASASVSASASSTALAVARGRAGQLLDRLIPVLARADRAQELAPVLSAQLGRGNSKQVARSFQVLLRRLPGSSASETLKAALGSPRLKVAERVALLRDSSEQGLFGRPKGDFVALLESLYDTHRDVGGAVLVAICRMGQTSLLTRVSQDEKSLYQLQVFLRQLSPTSDIWNDEVARVLATLCQRPHLGDQCLRSLADWARSDGAHDASTVAAVASAASEALTSEAETLWVPAAHCLVSLARLDSGPLVSLFGQLCTDCDAEGSDLLQASARLRILTKQLLGSQEKASEATLLAVAAAAFRAPSVLAQRAGLELWAARLHWQEPGKVLEALQSLPAPLNPILLPVLLSSCSESLKSQQPQGALRETCRALLEAETEPALVMLMAVVKFLFSGNWPPSTQVAAW